MSKVVCLCVDGSSAQRQIRRAVVDAFGWRGIALAKGQMKYSKSAAVPIRRYRDKLRALAKNNGGDPAALGLLVVGKSLGGAKMYRLAYDHATELDKFHKVAVVLVDAHEPLVPGNEGDTGCWYDYVHFTGGSHRLSWRKEKWGEASQQREDDARMRFYVIYQRNVWPKGYGMQAPFKRVILTRKKVRFCETGQKEPANHWNISWCDKTVDLLVDAIGFLS